MRIKVCHAIQPQTIKEYNHNKILFLTYLQAYDGMQKTIKENGNNNSKLYELTINTDSKSKMILNGFNT